MSSQGRQESMPQGPLAWMAGNSVAANLIMLFFLLGGLLMARNVTQEVFPEFSLDTVSVSIPYPGASPEEVEQGVVLAVEEAVQGLEGVKEVSSTAAEGQARVQVEALEGADVNRLWQDVDSAVSRIVTFPEEAEEPEITISESRRGVLTMAVSGPEDELVLREAAEIVRDELLQDSGISQVDLEGVRDLEIQVEVGQNDLRSYDLTLEDVAKTLRRASVDLGAGNIRTPEGDLLLRMQDRRDTAQEFARIPVISQRDGSSLLLGDLAQVRMGFEETDSWSRVNGKPAVMMEVYRIGSQTPASVSQATKEVLAELEQRFPEQIQTSILRDRSEVFQQRAQLLQKNAYLGLALVFILLAIFLEARLAFWVSLGIPISFLGSFLLLAGTSFSINMITMFAFIVTLGIVVDDAIVVGENIYYHRRQGLGMLQAAATGVREMAMPIVFSVLTNMVAFMPMFFIPGVMGKIFSAIPLVVICVFAVSLLECLFVLPAHLAHVREKREAGPLRHLTQMQSRFSQWIERLIQGLFGPALAMVLRWRYTALALGLAVLLGTLGYVQSGRMGMELFPTVESPFAFAEATLPQGAAREDLQQVEDRLTEAAEEVVQENGGQALARSILTVVNGNSVEARIYLTKPGKRPVGTSEVTRLWRERTGQITGLESIKFEADRGGPGGGKALTVQLSHRDQERLEQAGVDLGRSLEDYSGVSDIDDGSASGKRQLDIRLSELGQRLGLSSREVGDQVRHAYYGAEALRQQEGRNEITVRVFLPKKERRSQSSLEDMVLRHQSEEILFQDAVQQDFGRAYTSISRRDGRRVIQVTANVQPRSQVEQLVAELQDDVLPGLLQGYPGLSYSFEGRQADLRESVNSLMHGLLLALLALYALLAVPFRSFVQPVIIMACIPFGLVGAVFGHLIMGYSLSLMSLFGIVALSGVVINNSLVLIHFTNQLRQKGLELQQAAQKAGMLRFRPILLTTLTTFGGLSPMILETSRQARFLIPMAISLGFGLLFAMLVILFLVPCVYLLVEDIAGLLGLQKPRNPEQLDTEPTG
ncbi:MAG: efflux RND transporter permease subunit [Desulfohalobiaceae bacterium]